ncbi:MAG TPA: serine hydrolase, partial [Acidobacteriota bacterium]|nr:serine hydrolase [Acidobacteriota bacterium]
MKKWFYFIPHPFDCPELASLHPEVLTLSPQPWVLQPHDFRRTSPVFTPYSAHHHKFQFITISSQHKGVSNMRNPGHLLGAGLLSTVLLVGGTVPTLAYVQKEKTVASSTSATTPEVIAKIDQILSNAYPANTPGAAVLVSKDGKVVFRKGYGLADVEKKVPIQ